LAGTPLESAKAGPQDRNTWSLNFFTEREGLKTTAGQSENIVLSTPDFDTRSDVKKKKTRALLFSPLFSRVLLPLLFKARRTTRRRSPDAYHA
jgi:hypothetical protein